MDSTRGNYVPQSAGRMGGYAALLNLRLRAFCSKLRLKSSFLKARYLMFLICPLHQSFTRFASISLPPKGGKDRIPIFDSSGSQLAQVVCARLRVETNMADHHVLVAEPDSPEQARLEGRVVLKVVQTYSNEPLFCKPL